MPGTFYRAIPSPNADLQSLLASVQALKETVEVLTRQRKPTTAAAVTFQDLIDLGLIVPGQVPR